jgi:hypothetical protein
LYDLGFGAAVAPGLTEHAHRVWTDENAGGSSRNSEAMSMELLRRVQALSPFLTDQSTQAHSTSCMQCTYGACLTSL